MTSLSSQKAVNQKICELIPSWPDAPLQLLYRMLHRKDQDPDTPCDCELSKKEKQSVVSETGWKSLVINAKPVLLDRTDKDWSPLGERPEAACIKILTVSQTWDHIHTCLQSNQSESSMRLHRTHWPIHTHIHIDAVSLCTRSHTFNL